MSVVGLVLLATGVAIVTLGVVGLLRLPDPYMRLHAASKASFVGVVLVLAASIATLDAALILRSALVVAFLVLTTPVSSHAIGRVALREERRARREPPG